MGTIVTFVAEEREKKEYVARTNRDVYCVIGTFRVNTIHDCQSLALN